jgi:2-oxoglutarate dehydrogenase E2 component (dihydrolipoamide succinyltransferase)
MPVNIRIPELGESVSEAVIVRWLRQDGDIVRADEPLLEIETDKAAMEVVADVAGRLEIGERAGARLPAGAVVGRITEDVTVDGGGKPVPGMAEPQPQPSAKRPAPEQPAGPPTRVVPKPPAEPPRVESRPADPARFADHVVAPREGPAGPRQERLAARVTPATEEDRRVHADLPAERDRPPRASAEGDVDRVPMSPLRQVIAARLVEAQRTAAILTTFNEVDLSEVLALRARHRERFRARHGVDLGLVSLFGRAAIHALHEVPIVNAHIDGSDIVYHRRVHLGIAVSTPRGLVVPVVRDADTLSLAELERAIDALVSRARDGRLGPPELRGGTFTITNGGVFGSLLSTPILNPPQSGILGMHKIEQRPVALDGTVVIRPMMYIALSYDHRLVDGEHAVTFLVRLKEALEDPARMVLEV